MQKIWSKSSIVFLVLGLILIIGAPYLPDAFFSLIRAYDVRYSDFRFMELIPSVRWGGTVLSACGIALLFKKGDKK